MGMANGPLVTTGGVTPVTLTAEQRSTVRDVLDFGAVGSDIDRATCLEDVVGLLDKYSDEVRLACGEDVSQATLESMVARCLAICDEDPLSFAKEREVLDGILGERAGSVVASG
jgi:hypothetical protein